MSDPRLAVVVASVNGFPYLGECLDALTAQEPAVEIVVADWTDAATRARVASEWSHVRLLSFDEPTAVPELRAAGIFASAAPFVAVIEDHCVTPPGWAAAILAGHDAGYDVVGGPVRNAETERLRDWAAFLCEYSAFLEPRERGLVPGLTGMNVSYSRRAIAAIDDLLREGRWESDLHPRLQERGYDLWLEPEAVIEHAKDFDFREFASLRYHYSRSYAGMRNRDLGGKRWLYAAGSPLLVPLTLARVGRSALPRPAVRGPFLRSTPLILTYSAIWAWGELVGYAFGGGRSILQVR